MQKVDGNTTGTYDGILFAISGDKGKTIYATAFGDKSDKFVSLNDCLAELKCGVDDAALVVIEDCFSGKVYRYNNYNDRNWYEVGETRGYA